MINSNTGSGRPGDAGFDHDAAENAQPQQNPISSTPSRSRKRHVAQHSASAKRKKRAAREQAESQQAQAEAAAPAAIEPVNFADYAESDGLIEQAPEPVDVPASEPAAYEAEPYEPAAYEPQAYDVVEEAPAAALASEDPFYVEPEPEPVDPPEDVVAGYGRSYAKSRYTARKRRSGGRKAGVVVALALMAVLVACGVAAAVWYSGFSGNFGNKAGGPEAIIPAENEPYYVLLLGSDSRDGLKGYGGDPDMEGNRTDSIMVARIDEANKKVSLLSIPRDLRVNIPNTGYAKINAAFEYGGLQTLIDVLNNIFDIRINYYAFIYFDGFEDLVDKLGGVTVEVPEGTYYNGVTVPSGDAVLINGKEALTLARCRHGNPPDQGPYAMGEYQRTMNQRNLIKAIGKKVLQQDAASLPGLIEGLASCVETNMDITKIVAIAENMKGMDTESIDAAQLPIAGSSIYSDLEGYSEWFAIMYDDIFQVIKKNFLSGAPAMEGLDGVDTELYGDDVGSGYTDGEKYAYTNYEQHVIGFSGESSGIEALQSYSPDASNEGTDVDSNTEGEYSEEGY